MSHLFAVALGPVQGFIAAARKTKDLWYGSELLSKMSGEVASSLRGEGAKLIFPAEEALGNSPSNGGQAAVANKILAEVSGDPEALATHVRECVASFLSKECEQAISKAAKQLNDKLDQTLMRQQVEAFPEVYCAWWPYDGSQEQYATARNELEHLLAGRKALRDFQPNPGKADRPKSSLDGALESVTHDTRGLDAGPLRGIGLKRGEELDGVSLLKRVNAGERFVSVSRVALDPLIRRLSKEDATGLTALSELAGKLTGSEWLNGFQATGRLQCYKDFPFDTQLFYGPPTKQQMKDDPDHADDAVRFHDEVRKLCKQLNLGEPPLYYAVLVGDGDRMGKVIGGCTKPEEHREFSKELVKFASEAASIVAAHQGALVYSGGDDVLAFLPLDMALECADALQQKFRKLLGQYEGATFTCGIAICHYSEHLQNALRWAREAEKAAKKLRNALGIHLHTRTAGEEKVVAVAQWGEMASRDTDPSVSRSALVRRLLDWVQMLREDKIPDGAIFELRSLHREFRDMGLTDANALNQEILRIIKRKRVESGKKAIGEEEVSRMLSAIAGDQAEPDSMKDALDSLDRFVSEMIVARHVARAKDVAEKGE